ncbi:TIGR03986 family CRISPR-associated RAMP protein [Solwaraspora sp. WMMB335]|uniref:TIGR03986 family type III CRISPR-associated RAMP protein n=1 Tax=Solwaraspora sp. WMMB335 TaxID=3404118 RepID=UPI003B95AFAD
MSTSDDKLKRIIRVEAAKRGDVLEGVVDSSGKARAAKPKRLGPAEWDSALTEHVDTMAEGDTVTVEVVTDLAASGKRTVRLVGVAALAKVSTDPDRTRRLDAAGGFVNPYTFVPTLPRSDPDGTRLSGTGLDDVAPPSHAYHAGGQFTGTLALTLTTVTPLLLPASPATQPADGIRTFDVRVDPHGRPLIHGASLKGALRSAYETITASRYGVFFDHQERLAYRVTAEAAQGLTPARVHQLADGTTAFRLCQGDSGWARTSGNQTQYAALVPAYGTRRARLLGDLARKPLSEHHGAEVHARVVHGRDGEGSARAWRVTHLARTEKELFAGLEEQVDRSDRAAEGQHRTVQGWLSATGKSISKKEHERLFVETPGQDVPLTDDHKRYWQSVLRAYDLANGYNDPQATYRRDPATAGTIERSWHVPSTTTLRDLPAGTLVYVKYDQSRHEITEVHPVMIGRLPFAAAPGDLLHPSLHPAQDRAELSPADRLFGWVPAGGNDDGSATNDGASGYHGRLRVRSVTCVTPDWKPDAFPPDGVVLAPLSTPKPTQSRFYAASDQLGTPLRRGVPKAEGYVGDGGLRGRKMYRWREEAPGHWEPGHDHATPARGYLALPEHKQHATQLVRHRGWVRPGVTFQVELFLDAVPEAELGALLWLLTLGSGTPLRLGAGKPYGFGVVTTQLDWDRTRLWDAAGVRAGWSRLTRPDPVDADLLTALAGRFAGIAKGNEVLREATESYLAAARSVTEEVHYPRMTRQPQAESYQWFDKNDRITGRAVAEGWALPHVRDPDQRLPYLGGGDDERQRSGRSAAGGPGGQAPSPRSKPSRNQHPSGLAGGAGGRDNNRRRRGP